ncbi:outer membrane beta-barrel family protein [Flavobacterium amniphilum]|nr:outer membrane beta-barrel family protein [Flavobacterium amniphilum]
MMTTDSLYSQGNKIVVKTEFELEGISCEQDTSTVRKVDMHMLYNGNYISVKKFDASKCLNYYVVNRMKGKYKAQIQSESYLPSEMAFEITENSKDTIVLKAKLFKSGGVRNLNEVSVKSTGGLIKMEGNKTSYSIQNNDALNNGNVLESIKKLPGVMSDINGGLSLKGKSVTVYMDGLPINMSGQDLSNYLGSISSSSVSKIEIINNPGASYEAGTTADVVNIITKFKNQKGVNGNVYSGITFYQEKKYENSLSLNGLYKKMSWNASFGYNDIDTQSGMDKEIVDKDTGNYIIDKGDNSINQKPLNARFGLGYSYGSINFDVKYSFSGMNQETKATSSFMGNEDGVQTTQNSEGIQNVDSKRNELTTSFVYRINKTDKILKVNYQYFDFDRELDLFNESVLNNVSYYNDNSNKFSSNVNRLKIDLVLPFDGVKVSSGLKYSDSGVDSDGIYTNSLSNATEAVFFDYKDHSIAAYAELFKKIQKLSVTLGMRYEYLKMESEVVPTLKVDKQFSNFFPSFNLGYQLNSFTEVNLSYSRKVRLPGYQELDPNSGGFMSNLSGDGGNPFLQPSFYHNSELKFNFFKYADLSFSYSKAKSDNFLVFVKDDGTYKQTIEQFDNVRTFNSNLGVPVPLGLFTKGIKYLSTVSNINEINYLYFFGGINSVKYDKVGFENDFKNIKYLGVYGQFVLPYGVKGNLQYSYSTRGNFTIYNVEKSYNKLDLTLTKSIFKNSTKIQFSYNDLLNTGSRRYALFTNADLNSNVMLKNDTQRVKLSVTYNFGNFKPVNEKKDEVDERETKKGSLDVKI